VRGHPCHTVTTCESPVAHLWERVLLRCSRQFQTRFVRLPAPELLLLWASIKRSSSPSAGGRKPFADKPADGRRSRGHAPLAQPSLLEAATMNGRSRVLHREAGFEPRQLAALTSANLSVRSSVRVVTGLSSTCRRVNGGSSSRFGGASGRTSITTAP
jgi:hypothetical protein